MVSTCFIYNLSCLTVSVVNFDTRILIRELRESTKVPNISSKSKMAKVKSLRMEDDNSGFKNYPSKDEDTLTENQSWKNIIFIPFNKGWEAAVVLSLVLNFMIIIFDFVYTGNTIITYGVVYVLHLICEVIFYADTILTTMHR